MIALVAFLSLMFYVVFFRISVNGINVFSRWEPSRLRLHLYVTAVALVSFFGILCSLFLLFKTLAGY